MNQLAIIGMMQYMPEQKIRLTQLSPDIGFRARDGNGLQSIKKADGSYRLWNIAGWFSSEEGSTSEIIEYNDETNVWTSLGNAPFAPRHSFGFGTIMHGGVEEFWIYGGDLFGTTEDDRDMWRYTHANGWQRMVIDWGSVAGTRYLFAWCVHKNELFMLGGQTNYQGNASTTFYNDVLKFNRTTLTWQTVGVLPIPYASNGVLLSDGVNLIFMGGCKYEITGVYTYNTNVIKSTNDGATWASIATIPEIMEASYCNGVYWDGKFWYLNGSKTGTTEGPLGNRSRIWSFDEKFENLELLNASLAVNPRHATGICVHKNAIHFAFGNMWSDHWKIYKK